MSWIRCGTCDGYQNTDDGEEWKYLDFTKEFICHDCLDMGEERWKAYCSRKRIDRLLSYSETDNPLSDLKPNIQAMFRAWYPSNMNIVYEFYNQSLYLKTNGRRDHYSSQMIVHKIRWDSALNSDFDQYKLNQNIGSALGRIVMKLDPRLEGMFRIKNHLTESGNAIEWPREY